MFSEQAEAGDRDEQGDKSRVMVFLLWHLYWISSRESRIESNPSSFSWIFSHFPFKKLGEKT